MTYKREAFSFIVYFGLFIGCSENGERFTSETARLTANADPNPVVSFTQGAQALGIKRSTEPASASSCPQPPAGSTLSYGTWLSDFDGDGLLDVYDVNHGQGCHLSGLWLNNGAGSFGKNLWTVGVTSASTNGAALNLSNEMMYVGDMTGDGRVDMYFLDWSGLGAMCVNQGNAAHSDWTGPSFTCYQALEPRAFGDVNGDGKIDVEVIDATPPYDVYKDYCRTAPTSWRLNNGNPNFNTWPADSNYFDFVGKAAPGTLLDFNKDGYPDKIQGVEVTGAARGPYSTSSGGLRVSLGQPNGTYLPVTSGLESVVQPVVKIEDIDEDGCLDVGTDQTAYRDNQSWYLQDCNGTTCLATFHSVSRLSLPYFPGARRYSFDVDNDGLMDKAVIVHNGYGNQDGKKEGVHIFRKLPAGTWSNLGAVGININGTSNTEFYADELNPGDWNNDGKMDLAGVGNTSIAGADSGIALWTSNLSTTNKWIKVQLPTVTGFFAGAATIEIFDAGFVGDPAHYVTPPKVLRTGQVWTNQVHHFGIGTRSSVDLRVTLPNGTQNLEINGRDQPDDRRGRRGGRWRRHPLDGGRRGTGRHAGAATAGYASPVATTPAATHSHARASDNAHVRSRERRDAPGAARDGDRHLPASAARWRPERGHRRVGRCDRARHLGGGQQRQRLRARRRPGHDGQRRLAIDSTTPRTLPARALETS